tara:strand:- start:9381 stop:9515 length:135 start_codon:yes stop_codon:yes gene_type:complete
MKKYTITIELRTEQIEWFFDLMHDTTMELNIEETLEWAIVEEEE